MLRAACDFRNDHFEAKAFRDVERSLDILLVRTVSKLASVVIAPREELSVTSLFFIFVVYCNLEGRGLGRGFIQNLTFHKLASRLPTMRLTALIFAIATGEKACLVVTDLSRAIGAVVSIW